MMLYILSVTEIEVRCVNKLVSNLMRIVTHLSCTHSEYLQLETFCLQWLEIHDHLKVNETE